MNLPDPVVVVGAPNRSRRFKVRRWILILGLLGIVGLAVWSWLPRKTDLPLVAELRFPESGSHYFYPLPLSFSRDGSTLVTTRPGFGVALWDLSTKTIRREMKVTGDAWEGVLDREGEHLAVMSYRRVLPMAFFLTIFDVSGSKEPITIALDQRSAFNLAFSDDAREIGLITWESTPKARPYEYPGEFRSWDVVSGKEFPSRKWTAPYRNLIEISRDQKTLLVGNRNQTDVRIWDLATGQSVGELSVSGVPAGTLNHIKVFPDGKTVALGRQDGTLELWDLESRMRRTMFRSHTKNFYLYRMVGSTDSNLLVSEATEQLGAASVMRKANYLMNWALARGKYEAPVEMLVWDLRTRRLRAKLPNETRSVLSEDGKMMATTSGPGVVRVWDLSTR